MEHDAARIWDIAAILVFLAGIIDIFRIYLRVFRRCGGFENFLFSHLSGTLLGFLRFIPYFVVSAILLAFGTG